MPPFELKKAVRGAAPSWIALGGPSGGGKTKSALRLATGIVRVTGGRIAVIDTEADRAKVYAPKDGERANPPHTFDFDHLTFGPPFGSLRYLEAAEHCISKGAKVIIVDSFSHEHESIGGVLEQFEDELERLSGGDQKKAERVKFLAWKNPKAGRRRMINGLLQSPVSIIGCFRTQNKLAIQRGEDPMKLGAMPITGAEFVYEFPLRLLLQPGSDGAPNAPEMPGEKEWVRVPDYFRDSIKPGVQLSEDIGEALARWAAGGGALGATTQPASPEQVEEIKVELGRLKWTTKQIREWCATYGGATWPDKIPGDKAIPALQALLAMPDPPG